MTLHIDYKALGRRIGDLRYARGLTQEQIAQATGLSVQFIGNIERGASTPSVKTLYRIALALDVPPGDLFDRSFATIIDDENVLRQQESLFCNTLTSQLMPDGTRDIEEPVFEDIHAVFGFITLDDDIQLDL